MYLHGESKTAAEETRTQPMLQMNDGDVAGTWDHRLDVILTQHTGFQILLEMLVDGLKL